MSEKTIEQLIKELQEIKQEFGNIKAYNVDFYIEGSEEEPIITI